VSGGGGYGAISAPYRPPTFVPEDHGLLAWSFDPYLAANSVQVSTAATLYRFKLKIPTARTITNVHFLVTSGGTFTTGQNFVALYSSAKALLSGSADQTANMGGTGLKTMPLSTPQAVPPGIVYAAFWMNGSNLPTLARGTALSSAVPNANLSAANARVATANGSLTTGPAPATIGAETASSQALWIGLS
jgi:hypothetical protein